MFNKILKGLFKLELLPSTLHNYQISKSLKKLQCDYIISEAAKADFFKYLNKKNKYKDFFYHIHAHTIPDVETSLIFNKILGVSQFVADEWMKNSSNKKSKLMNRSLNV